MHYIIILCISIYFSRKPLWNKVKLIHITMVALNDNLIITILHTKSGDQNDMFLKYLVFKQETRVNSSLLLSVIKNYRTKQAFSWGTIWMVIFLFVSKPEI